MHSESALRALRDHLGLTQSELAGLLRVSQPAISSAERDGCSAELALRVADLHRPAMHRLGLTVEDLIRGRRHPIPTAGPRDAA